MNTMNTMTNKETTTITPASWLREARQKAGATQAEAARSAGLSLETIRAIEQGRSQGSRRTIERLAGALGTEVPDIHTDGPAVIGAPLPPPDSLASSRTALRDTVTDLAAGMWQEDLAAMAVVAEWLTARQRLTAVHGPEVVGEVAPSLDWLLAQPYGPDQMMEILADEWGRASEQAEALSEALPPIEG